MMAGILLMNCWIILSLIYTCLVAEACPPLDVYLYESMTISPNLSVYSPGDVITCKCTYCYEPDAGDFTRTCRSDGTWTGTPPSCKERDYTSFKHDVNHPNITQYYRTVTQSSDEHGQASLAVDGSLRTYTTVVKGSEDTAQWRLEFCTKMLITGLKIWNRPRSVSDDLKDIPHDDQKLCNIFVMADNEYCGEVTPDHCIEPGESVKMLCVNIPLVWLKKTLFIVSTDGSPFSLAEVEVFADINDEWYTDQQYSVQGTNPLVQFLPLK